MLILLLALLMLLGFEAPGEARILRVPMQFPSLQDALKKANSGDIILVAPGEYHLFFQNIVIKKDFISIIGEGGPERTKLVGMADGPVITVAKDVQAVIEGLTITSEGTLPGPVRGGGIFCSAGSRPIIIGNIFLRNRAVFGGAIYCDVRSMPVIVENIFLQNQAKVSGGAIFTDRATVTISRNRFHGNSAGSSGGGIGCNRDSSAVNNNIFWRNTARFGGAISCDRAATFIYNNTIVGNQAQQGGAILVEKGSTRLMNLILWDNGNGDICLRGIGPAARPAYSDMQDTIYRGINGNISKDPRFVDPGQGNFHLQSGSPCIDKGNPNPFFQDKDGSFNDMGAYGGPDPMVDKDLPSFKGEN